MTTAATGEVVDIGNGKPSTAVPGDLSTDRLGRKFLLLPLLVFTGRFFLLTSIITHGGTTNKTLCLQ